VLKHQSPVPHNYVVAGTEKGVGGKHGGGFISTGHSNMGLRIGKGKLRKPSETSQEERGGGLVRQVPIVNR